MEATNNTPDKKYLSILADAKFHQEVPEGTEGAVVREYEKSTGESGSKTELVYSEVSGIITNISFQDSDFSKNLQIELDDDGVIFANVESSYGEDLMKKLKSIDLSEKVTFAPYSFEDDNGKRRRGVTVKQDGEKISNYYFDSENKEAINGLPEPEGDTSEFDKDDWKMHFMKVRKFLIKEVEGLIAEKFSL